MEGNKMALAVKIAIASIGILAVVITYIYLPSAMPVMSAFAGILSGIVFLLLISPALKNYLLHDPDKPKKPGLFVQVDTGRAVAIDFGGTYFYKIKGGEPPVKTEVLFGLWMLYKNYIWLATKLHVYVPFFMQPKSYDLPRYEVDGVDGKRVYNVIERGTDGFRSNHVRIAPFTWYFEYAGAEIQTIPFIIKGSAQVLIPFDKVEESLYLTESWNVLLDQALSSVIRSVVRGQVTLDMVIGAVMKDIWAKETASDEDVNQIVARMIMEGVEEYKFRGESSEEEENYAGKKLTDLGPTVLRVDITDFEDELTTPEEKSKLRAAAFGRQTGRGKDLDGQGIAAAQKHQRDVHAEGGEASQLIVNADALVRAAAAGNLDALLASFIQNRK
jgi:hypothetical protein